MADNLSKPSILALAELRVWDLDEGQRCWVEDEQMDFLLRKAPPVPGADGVNFIASIYPGAVWQRDSGSTPVTAVGTVGTAAALSALPDDSYDSGAIFGVRSYGDTFVLDRASTLPAEDNVVLRTASGVGRYIRRMQPSLAWARQSTWYIHPTTGSDENSGQTSASALKTVDELMRRLKGQVIAQTTTVNVLGDITGRVRIDVEFGASFAYIQFVGQRTVLYSSTFSAVTAYAHASQQEDLVTNAALPVSWTASGLVGKLMRVTSGAGQGGTSVVAKDLGGKQARVARFFDYDLYIEVQPAIGNAFEVYSVTKFGETLLELSVRGNGQILLIDLEAGNPDPGEVHSVSCYEGNIFFFGCIVHGLDCIGSQQVQLVACKCDNGCRSTSGSSMLLTAGLLTRDGGAIPQCRVNSYIATVDAPVMIQGMGGTVEEAAVFAVQTPTAFFDSATAMTVEPNGILRATAAMLWGKGVATTGIDVKGAGLVVYAAGNIKFVSPTPTNFCMIGGASTAEAGLPATNAAKLCGVVLP